MNLFKVVFGRKPREAEAIPEDVRTALRMVNLDDPDSDRIRKMTANVNAIKRRLPKFLEGVDRGEL